MHFSCHSCHEPSPIFVGSGQHAVFRCSQLPLMMYHKNQGTHQPRPATTARTSSLRPLHLASILSLSFLCFRSITATVIYQMKTVRSCGDARPSGLIVAKMFVSFHFHRHPTLQPSHIDELVRSNFPPSLCECL